MFLADYHLHSRYSVDGRGFPAAYGYQAVHRGLKEIAFVDHLDLNPASEGFGYLDFSSYVTEIGRCRGELDGCLAVRVGLELGEPHLYQDQLAGLLADKPFDVLLGSVHWVGDEALHRDFCAHHPAREAYELYFSEVLRAAQAGGFHVLAHLDLLKRYAPPTYGNFYPEDFQDIIVAILETVINQGMALEINTSGLRQRVAEALPGMTVLQWYRQRGGELITLGSDAHRPDDVAAGLPTAAAMARAAGFAGVTVFCQGRASLVPWDQGG